MMDENNNSPNGSNEVNNNNNNNGTYNYSNPYNGNNYSGNAYNSTGSYGGNASHHQGNSFQPDTGKSNKKKNNSGKIIAAATAAALVGGLVGSGITGLLISNRTPVSVESSAQADTNTQSAPNAAVTPPAAADGAVTAANAGGSMTIAQVADNGLPSVVAITNKGVSEIRTMWGNFSQESESAGSGVIIGQTDTELLVVTNYHVVSGSQELNVVFSYEEDTDNPSIASAKVKAFDSDKDLAVISIPVSELTADTLSQIKVVTIGDSDSMELGEQVVAIGNALGYGQSVTTGIVSALKRDITLQSDDGSQITNSFLQTDAAINPGNSGGALFNMKGELIGINSAKASSANVEGMGYAIPISSEIDHIQEMMNQETRDVAAEAERGYLGITGTSVTSDINQAYGIPVGVYVSGVTPGTAADTAGIKQGYVITGMDGYSVTSISALKERLTYYKAGESVDLTLQVPSGNTYTESKISVTLSTAQSAGVSDGSSAPDAQEQLPGQIQDSLIPDFMR